MGNVRLKNQVLHYWEYTTPKTTSCLAVRGRHVFGGILLLTDGINNITLNIYDSLTASGKRLIPPNLLIKGSRDYFPLSVELLAHNGSYVNITCSGTYSFQVYYDKG